MSRSHQNFLLTQLPLESSEYTAYDHHTNHMLLLPEDYPLSSTSTIFATSTPKNESFPISINPDGRKGYIVFNDGSDTELLFDIGSEKNPIFGIYLANGATLRSSKDITIYTKHYEWDFSSVVQDGISIKVIGEDSSDSHDTN